MSKITKVIKDVNPEAVYYGESERKEKKKSEFWSWFISN